MSVSDRVGVANRFYTSSDPRTRTTDNNEGPHAARGPIQWSGVDNRCDHTRMRGLRSDTLYLIRFIFLDLRPRSMFLSIDTTFIAITNYSYEGNSTLQYKFFLASTLLNKGHSWQWWPYYSPRLPMPPTPHRHVVSASSGTPPPAQIEEILRCGH